MISGGSPRPRYSRQKSSNAIRRRTTHTKARNNQKRAFVGGLGSSLQKAVNLGQYALFVNDPDLFDPAFRRYLEHRFRDTFPFPEVPVRLDFRRRDRKPLDQLKR